MVIRSLKEMSEIVSNLLPLKPRIPTINISSIGSGNYVPLVEQVLAVRIPSSTLNLRPGQDSLERSSSARSYDF